MTERITISNVLQFVEYARKDPTLLNIGSFGLLRSATAAAPTKGCNCGKKKGVNDVSALRPQFEAAMVMLSVDEQNKLKAILDTNKLCYYSKNELGQLKQVCF